MKKQILCGVLLSLMILCACQPTPTEEAVINRADGLLEQSIRKGSVEPYDYEAPERWEETYFERNQEVRISADVEVPTKNQFPVVTIKKHSFTASDVNALLSSYHSGNWMIRENEYSLDELVTDLQNVAKGALVDVDEETGELVWEPYEGQEEELNRINQLIAEAPAEDIYTPLTEDRLQLPITRQRLKDPTGTSWYLIGNQNMITLSLHRDGNIQMENWVMQGDATPGEEAHSLKNIHISEEEAVKLGNAIVEDLGLTNFRVAEIQKARETQSYTYSVYGEGYWLVYVPTLEGTIPCYYGGYVDPDFLNFTQDNETTTYSASWAQEHVSLFITEKGVSFISWSDAKDIVLTANENVNLLPFDNISNALKKLLEYGTGGSEGSPILVKRIVLTSSVAQIPNQGDEAFLVPTWAVFLTSEHNEKINIDMGVLLINAIDGTYVNRFGRY